MTNVQIENGKKRYQFAELDHGDFFYFENNLCIKVIQNEMISSVAIYAISINKGRFIKVEPYDEVELVTNIKIFVNS